MKTRLKRFLGGCTLRRSALLLGVTTCASVFLPLSALSTPSDRLDFSYATWKCDSGYNVKVVYETTGKWTYHATGPTGEVNLGNGIQDYNTGRIVTFKNGTYVYQVTLDHQSRESGTLEVFKNNKRVLMQSCRAR